MFYSTGDTVKKVVSQNENITSVANMFESSDVESLDLSNFKTFNITNMSNMFSRAQKLTNVNMSNWDTSNVTNMSHAFDYAINLKNIDVSKWDTSNVENNYMTFMFFYNTNLKVLDLTSFGDFTKVKSSTMFSS